MTDTPNSDLLDPCQHVALDMANLFLKTNPTFLSVIGGVGMFLEAFLEKSVPDKGARFTIVTQFCSTLIGTVKK